MKKQLFLYLFIVSALINVFTYMYYSKKDATIEKRFEDKNKRMKDSISQFENVLYDANYFSLENNQNAQEYHSNYDVTKLLPQIKDALLAYNDAPEGNKYIDQPKMGEQKFIINKIKVLNHRWIVADYSNGTLWGDVLIKYFVKEDNSITFETIETFLYPKQQME
ncbi:hypothetical protein [Flavobacterium aquatile]|uniref:Hydrolase n=1 Tax=Flavobacterium aquatile LMG 4008 = ATCC 11947 TaxID=1453498 RepID=A0A095U276_9FLAO|nr:hypothetical protein [Flavobacterium aquatile]KGD68683.1 hypothetical protein LG45_03290 [Flavobacterium aquatile LMG 4008 = ATCC 11947]OXA66376.1 hypothetical protein B0A61_11720 [Flavobacterium aquatile LMG 4008 = ATCC 11947]GEC79506.1 hypothetical protein FAQ01_23760 [Flavobacterium aquatile]